MSLRSRATKEEKDNQEYLQTLEQERLILAATDLLESLLAEQGIRRTDLAKLLGTTKGNVTQLLSGERNLTLRTLADLAYHVGHRVRVEAQPLAEAPRFGATNSERYRMPVEAWRLKRPTNVLDLAVRSHERICRNRSQHSHAQEWDTYKNITRDLPVAAGTGS